MPLHMHLLEKWKHMYKYAKIGLTFLVHIKHQVVDGIALSIHCGSKGAHSSITIL